MLAERPPLALCLTLPGDFPRPHRRLDVCQAVNKRKKARPETGVPLYVLVELSDVFLPEHVYSPILFNLYVVCLYHLTGLQVRVINFYKGVFLWI